MLAGNSVYFLIHYRTSHTIPEKRRYGHQLTEREAILQQLVQAAQFIGAKLSPLGALLASLTLTSRAGSAPFGTTVQICFLLAPLSARKQHEKAFFYLAEKSDFPFYLLFSRTSPLKYAFHAHINILC